MMKKGFKVLLSLLMVFSIFVMSSLEPTMVEATTGSCTVAPTVPVPTYVGGTWNRVTLAQEIMRRHNAGLLTLLTVNGDMNNTNRRSAWANIQDTIPAPGATVGVGARTAFLANGNFSDSSGVRVQLSEALLSSILSLNTRFGHFRVTTIAGGQHAGGASDRHSRGLAYDINRAASTPLVCANHADARPVFDFLEGQRFITQRTRASGAHTHLVSGGVVTHIEIDGHTGGGGTVEAPRITVQPVGQNRTVGQTATFTVTATGVGRTYQWQWRNPNTGAWQPVVAVNGASGMNTRTLTQANVQQNMNNWDYRVRVTNGGVSVYSNTVRLTVGGAVAAPTITGQPISITRTVGQTASFTVTATGTNRTYQWQWRNPNTGAWQNVIAVNGASGMNTRTLTQANVQQNMNNWDYRVIISTPGGGSVTSQTVRLTVGSAVAAPTITGQPISITRTVGQTASFTVTATGTNRTYQWQWRNPNTGAWQNVIAVNGASGMNTRTLTQANVQQNMNNWDYRVIISTPGGTVTSQTVRLTVGSAVAAPTITVQPTNQNRTVGQTASFTVTATGTNRTYQWLWWNANTQQWQNVQAIGGASGMTTRTLTQTNVQRSMNNWFYVVRVTTAGGSVYSNVISLTVN